jgi:carboxypeptidase family protein
MRKLFVFAVSFAMALVGTPLGVSAGVSGRQQPQTGGVQGVAKNAQQQNLSGVKVQVRGLDGQLAATGNTDSTGAFSVAGLAPGTYTIEIVDAAGNIVGTSAAVVVTAGSVATVTVTASAAGAITAAGRGGLSLFGLGTIGTVAIIGVAAAGTIAAIVATQNNASPSR